MYSAVRLSDVLPARGVQSCGRPLSGRFVALTADDLTGFQLFLRWSFCLSPQVLSARKISVADSYCNVFGSVLICFLRSFVCTFVGSRVVSFVYSFLRSFVLSLFRPCLHWFRFFVPGWCFGAFALCDVCRCYLLVTSLRLHPAVTRLTVYRRPYIGGSASA